jgi:hypothetical protein
VITYLKIGTLAGKEFTKNTYWATETKYAYVGEFGFAPLVFSICPSNKGLKVHQHIQFVLCFHQFNSYTSGALYF